MIGLILLFTALTARFYYGLRGFMPTNILLDAIHTRRGLKWGVPAMLLAVPYALVAQFFQGVIAAGGPGWLHIPIMICLWNIIKFVMNGPVTVLQLVVVRIREAFARHRDAKAARAALARETEDDGLDLPVMPSRLPGDPREGQ